MQAVAKVMGTPDKKQWELANNINNETQAVLYSAIIASVEGHTQIRYNATAFKHCNYLVKKDGVTVIKGALTSKGSAGNKYQEKSKDCFSGWFIKDHQFGARYIKTVKVAFDSLLRTDVQQWFETACKDNKACPKTVTANIAKALKPHYK
jgi:hypothetical protein